ncbi:MAG: hypothetical protein ABEI06_07465 [Halobacteriaceae archaeon]
MVSIVTIYAVVFFVAMFIFTIGIVWISLKEDAHTPKALRSDNQDEE